MPHNRQEFTETRPFLGALESILSSQDLILACLVKPVQRPVDGEHELPIHLVYSVRVEDCDYFLDYSIGQHDPKDKPGLIQLGVSRINDEISSYDAELTQLRDGRICLRKKNRAEADHGEELVYDPIEERYDPPKLVEYTGNAEKDFLEQTGTTDVDLQWGGRENLARYLLPG